MTTAGKARRTSQLVRSEQGEQREQKQREHEKNIKAQVLSKVGELRPGVFRKIEDASRKGRFSCTIECYEYSMDSSSNDDRVRVLAYEKIVGALQRVPYRFCVTKEQRNGYNGEGNNMSDFYTVHSWTISW